MLAVCLVFTCWLIVGACLHVRMHACMYVCFALLCFCFLVLFLLSLLLLFLLCCFVSLVLCCFVALLLCCFVALLLSAMPGTDSEARPTSFELSAEYKWSKAFRNRWSMRQGTAAEREEVPLDAMRHKA